MRVIRLLCLFMVSFSACEESTQPLTPIPKQEDTAIFRIDSVIHPAAIDKELSLEVVLKKSGLVDIHDLDTTIRVELKYSTTDNFLSLDMYGDLVHCYLQPDVALKLVEAQKHLRKKYPYYSLIIYDAVRPLHIQKMMWDTLHLPPGEKQKYLSNPANGSLHNYGAAIDLSIVDANGFLLDMGTPYDYFGVKAHPEKENELLASGELSARHIFNREILRGVMYNAGFFGIQTEWWHFNSCTREEAAKLYKIVE